MRDAGTTAPDVENVDITLTGPIHLAAECTEPWGLFALGLPWLAGATETATFELVPASDARSNAPTSVSIDVDGDATRFVALVRTAQRTWAVTGSGRSLQFAMEARRAAVQVIRFRDRTAALHCVAWVSGPPAEPPPPSTFPDFGGMLFPIDVDLPGIIVTGGGGPDEAASPVAAYASAHMPAMARVGQPVVVRFTLGWRPETAPDGTTFDTEPVMIVPELPVRVSIAMRGYELATKRSTRVLRLHHDKAMASATFTLTGSDAGPGEVTIAVRQDAELPVATLRLVSEIVSGAVTSDQPATDTDAIVEPDSALTVLPTIRIDESSTAAESILRIAAQTSSGHVADEVTVVGKQKIVADTYERIATLRAELRRSGSTDEERTRAALDGLRTIGVELSRRLLGPRVREFLWAHVAELDRLVIQTTGEFDIPWEILYVSDPRRAAAEQPLRIEQFLGMCGATRWVYDAPRPINITVHRRRARYLCPAYTDPRLRLTLTQDERELVRSTFGAAVIRPGDAPAVSTAVAGGFDLLHFAGHGVWTQSPPEQRLLLARYRTQDPPPESVYSASDLRRDLPDLSARRPLVFLNACDVGRIANSAPGSGGFPEAFVRGGAGIFIGCSWAVDDNRASRFASDLYTGLIDGKTIATAATVARRASLLSADVSGLAYAIYADPRATVTVG